MATLALSVAGAGLGSLTGIGASTGWMLGSTLGRLLTSDNRQAPAGIQDLKISGASYGSVIPTLYGTMRLAGTVIWAGALRRQTSRSSGGKGGAAVPSGPVRTNYFTSFAIAFARGPVDGLLKIWADGTLIYDARSAGEKKQPDLRFRFYEGDEDQLPDSIIESEMGADNTPAYRGLCYLVFDNLLLAPYGNRLPNIEVLITKQAIPGYPQQSGDMAAFDPAQLSYDPDRQLLYTYEPFGGTDKMRKINVGAMAVQQSVAIDAQFPRLSSSFDGFSRDRNGHFWAGTGFAKLPGRAIHRFNTVLMNTEISADLPVDIGAISYSTDIIDPLTGQSFQVAGSQQSAQVVIFDQDLTVTDSIDCQSLTCSGVLRDADESAWVVMTANDTLTPFDDTEIIHVSTVARPSVEGTRYQAKSDIYTISSADLTPGAGAETTNHTKLVAILNDRRELVLINNYRLFKWSMRSASMTVWTDTDISDLKPVAGEMVGDSLVFLKQNRWLVYLSVHDLQETDRVDLFAFTGIGSFKMVAYDGRSDSLVVVAKNKSLRRLYLRRKDGSGAAFSSVITALTISAGLGAKDVDVTAISGEIGGYVIVRNMTVQDALEPLLLAGNFTVTESGYQLKFQPQDGTSVADIPYDDLMAAPERGRIQESELPGAVSLSYMAMDAGYQTGAQSVKRSYAPHATMYGRNERALVLPMALNAVTAREICRHSLYSAWAERTLQKIRLPLRYLALDAADVITLTEGANSYHGRLNLSYMVPDLSLDLEMVGAVAIGDTGEILADAGSGYSEILITRPLFSELFVLDLPLLRDEDATAGAASRYYYGASANGSAAAWGGAEIFKSAIGERFDQVGEVTVSTGWGVAANALPDVIHPWQSDWQNSLIVSFISGGGGLESVSDLDMLNGANMVLAGQEIIQFSQVIPREDGSFELSNLLRARRGTDWATATHRAGERVVILDTGTLQRGTVPLSDLDNSRLWKAVSHGQLLEQVTAQKHRLGGTDLKPYAPVHVTAMRSAGAIALSWQRRSRIGGGSLAGLVPLSEASECYELQLAYDEKTVSKFVSNQMSFAYQLTDFNEDFKLPLLEIPQLELQLFQLSEAIGRGFPAKEII